MHFLQNESNYPDRLVLKFVHLCDWMTSAYAKVGHEFSRDCSCQLEVIWEWIYEVFVHANLFHASCKKKKKKNKQTWVNLLPLYIDSKFLVIFDIWRSNFYRMTLFYTSKLLVMKFMHLEIWDVKELFLSYFLNLYLFFLCRSIGILEKIKSCAFIIAEIEA